MLSILARIGIATALFGVTTDLVLSEVRAVEVYSADSRSVGGSPSAIDLCTSSNHAGNLVARAGGCRRKYRGRAVLSMTAIGDSHRLCRAVHVVRPAASVDVNVDEAGRQIGSLQVDDLACKLLPSLRRADILDQSVFSQQFTALDQPIGEDQRPVHEQERQH